MQEKRKEMSNSRFFAKHGGNRTKIEEEQEYT